MKKKRITSSPSGAALLPVLMLFFIFFNPSPNTGFRAFEDHLKIRALTVDQIIFRDSNPSESLDNTLVKFSLLDCDFASHTVDMASHAVALSEAFSITHSTFNSFYNHITINAP